MQFTYTFPPLLWFGYQVIIDAMSADNPHVLGKGTSGRVDTWKDWSRWKRVRTPMSFECLRFIDNWLQGLFGGRWYFKTFNLTLGLAGLATACIGIWGTSEVIKETFTISGAATSFGCTAPV